MGLSDGLPCKDLQKECYYWPHWAFQGIHLIYYRIIKFKREEEFSQERKKNELLY